MMRWTLDQANACALKLVLIMEALEDAEQFLGVVRIETGAVVPDEDYCLGASIGITTYAPRHQSPLGARDFQVHDVPSLPAELSDFGSIAHPEGVGDYAFMTP
jgi:hypothetical protein